jgi:hypothetical protein
MRLKLVEKYDIALSYFIGVEGVDEIAEAKNEKEVVDVLLKLQKKKTKRWLRRRGLE